MNYPKQVKIREVGPRDGLQSINKFIPTKAKIKLINCLIDSGLKDIQVTSFVSPKAVPQLQDAEEVVRGIKSPAAVNLSALVANVQGAHRAINSEIKQLQFVISVSETHNLHNTKLTIANSLSELEKITEIASAGNASVSVALATAFGCPFEGAVPYEAVYKLINQVTQYGIMQITLADTASMLDITSLETMLQSLKKDFPKHQTALHLHAPQGLGMDSIITALDFGIDTFETSLGGLGGCPFIPNAVGNIATEALVTTLHLLGIQTGIDLFKIKNCAAKMSIVAQETAQTDINLNAF